MLLNKTWYYVNRKYPNLIINIIIPFDEIKNSEAAIESKVSKYKNY